MSPLSPSADRSPLCKKLTGLTEGEQFHKLLASDKLVQSVSITPTNRSKQVQTTQAALPVEGPVDSEMTTAPPAQTEAEVTESKDSEAGEANKTNEAAETNGQATSSVKVEDPAKEDEVFSWL